MLTWPPTLDDLKADRRIGLEEDRDDDLLDADLGAAIAFVVRVRGEDLDLTGDSGSDLPEPGEDVTRGTIMLAVRLGQRRLTPDGLLALAELGATRVPSVDPDIDRLLGIGRFRDPVFA